MAGDNIQLSIMVRDAARAAGDIDRVAAALADLGSVTEKSSRKSKESLDDTGAATRTLGGTTERTARDVTESLNRVNREWSGLGPATRRASSESTSALGRVDDAMRDTARATRELGDTTQQESRQAGNALGRVDRATRDLGDTTQRQSRLVTDSLGRVTREWADIGPAARRAGSESSDSMRDLQDEMDNTADSGSGVAGAFKTIALAAVAAFSISTVVDFFKQSAEAASHLAETTNKVQVVFGAQADTIFKFSKSAAESMGLSDLAARNATSTIGAMGKAAGLTGTDVSNFAMKFTGLASDLASFYDTSPEDAIEAIGAALRGESEPIRAYGVMLDDATLQQTALSMGLIKTTKDVLPPYIKAQAASKAIMEQTVIAQGDHGRTADGVANKQRTMAAMFENAQTQIGEAFLPAWQKLLGFLNDTAIPALATVGSAISGLTTFVMDIPGPVMAAVGAFTAMLILGQVVGFLRGLVYLLPIIISGMGGLAGAAGIASAAMAALGGPWVLAIGAVVGAFAFLAASQKDTTIATNDLSDAVDKNTGKLKTNATAIIAPLVTDAAKAYAAAGGSVGDYTQALAGNGPAQDRIQAQIRATAIEAAKGDTSFGALRRNVNGVRETTEHAVDRMMAVPGALSAQGGALGAAGAVLDAYRTNLGNVNATQANTNVNLAETAAAAHGTNLSLAETNRVLAALPKADPIALMKDQIKSMGDAAASADVAIQFLKARLDELNGKALTTEAAARLNAASFRGQAQATADVALKQRAATDALSKFGAKSPEYQQASRDLAGANDTLFAANTNVRDSAIKMSGAAYDNQIQQGHTSSAVGAATTVMEAQRKKYIDTRMQAGETRREAEGYANKLGLIPKDVRTVFAAPHLAAVQEQVNTLNKTLDGMQNKTVKYFVVGGTAVKYDTSDKASMSTTSYLIDQLYGNKKAAGGYLSGPGTGTSDSIPALVSNGEFIVNAQQTAQHRGHLENLNAGKYSDGGGVQRYAGGGLVRGDFTQEAFPSGMDLLGGPLKSMTAWIQGQADAAMAAAMGGGAWTPGEVAGARGKFLDAVGSKMGTAYGWGDAGPNTFDCSGLMSWGLQQAGIGFTGRLTAEDFNRQFPHVKTEQPGNLVTFDTGRLPGRAGHIGAISDANRGLMMHTDGAGPARISDYRSRDGGPLSIINPIGGSYTLRAGSSGGDPSAFAVGSGRYGATRGLNTVDPISDFGPQNMRRGTASMVGPIPPGGAEERWRPVYLRALQMLGKPLGGITAMMYQMSRESSGDPLSYNNTDSNFRAGHPSKSLLQTIPSTFKAHAAPGYNTNIWDPLFNALASLDYIGDPYSYPGGSYDQGGLWPSGTAGRNTSGATEAVLTPAERTAYQQHARSLVGAGAPAGGTTVNVGDFNFVVHGNLDRATAEQLQEDFRRQLAAAFRDSADRRL